MKRRAFLCLPALTLVPAPAVAALASAALASAGAGSVYFQGAVDFLRCAPILDHSARGSTIVHLHRGTFSAQEVRELLGAINEALGGGHKVTLA